MTTHTLTSLLELAATDEGREQIRVMVAEAMGWKFNVRKEDELWWTTRPSGGGSGMTRKLTYDEVFGIFKVPNYPRDLNAIAECEAGLTDRHERIKYQNTLAELTTVDGDECSLDSEFAHMCASALHRSIAFILAKQEMKGEK